MRSGDEGQTAFCRSEQSDGPRHADQEASGERQDDHGLVERIEEIWRGEADEDAADGAAAADHQVERGEVGGRGAAAGQFAVADHEEHEDGRADHRDGREGFADRYLHRRWRRPSQAAKRRPGRRRASGRYQRSLSKQRIRLSR